MADMTDPVINKLEVNNIILTKVLANMRRYFQPLDLTVNGYVKQYTKRKCVDWYSKEIVNAIDNS